MNSYQINRDVNFLLGKFASKTSKSELTYYIFCLDNGVYDRLIKVFDDQQIRVFDDSNWIKVVVNRSGGWVLCLLKEDSPLDIFPIDLLRLMGFHPVHAAALSIDGFCLLFVGGSGSGKTTLSIYLIREGFKLLSDDCCLLMRDGSAFKVLSLPRDVGLYLGNVKELHEFSHLREKYGDRRRRVKINEIYGDCVVDEAYLRGIVFIEWAPHLSTRFKELSPIEALAGFLPHGISLIPRQNAQEYLNFIGNMFERTPSFKLWLGSDKHNWHMAVKNILQISLKGNVY